MEKKNSKQLYAIRRFGFGGEIEYFNFCIEEWFSESCFNNFCVCNKDLAIHYAKRLGIKEMIAFNVTIEEVGKEGDDDYFPCSSDSCEDYGPGGYSPVD